MSVHVTILVSILSLYLFQLQYDNIRVAMTLSKRAKLWRTIKNNNMLESYVKMNI